jgi:hypothetical protein
MGAKSNNPCVSACNITAIKAQAIESVIVRFPGKNKLAIHVILNSL